MSLIGAVKARPVQKRSPDQSAEDWSPKVRPSTKNGRSVHPEKRAKLPAPTARPAEGIMPIETVRAIEAFRRGQNGTRRGELHTGVTAEAVIESSDAPIFSMDCSGRMTACNAAFRELWSGRSFDLGDAKRSVEAGVAPFEARTLWQNAFEGAMLGEHARFEQTFDVRSVRRTIEFTLNPICEGEDVVGISGIGRDITALREEDKALAALNAKYRLLFEDSPAPMWVIDPDTLRFVQVNRAAREYYGYSAEEFAKMTLLDIRPPQGHTFSRFMKTERYSHGTWVHAKRDGTVIFMEGISNPIDFEGKPASLALLKDITRHLEAEEALVDANERFRLAAEAVNSLIYEWNIEAGTVLRSVLLNSITGYDPADAETQTLDWWFDRVHAEDRDMLRATMMDATVTQQSNFNAEYRIRHRDGHYIYLWDRGLVVRDEKGKAIRVVGSAQDITERRQMEAQLEQERFAALRAKEQAEEMNRLKSSFLANISHEVRTPMTAILGFASVLAESIADKESSEYASMILSSGTRLLRTINGILDLARSEASPFKLRPSSFDVVAEARRAVRMLDPLASPKGLTLEFHTEVQRLDIVTDPGYLAQIITNLVGNALKFTAAGTVSVHMRKSEPARSEAMVSSSHRTSDLPKGEYFIIMVEDSGIGISEEFLPHIFDEFKQESSGYGREFEGTGLGLTITHRIVQAMGGSIEVSTQRGHGSTFLVRLPYRTVVELPQPSLQIAEPTEPASIPTKVQPKPATILGRPVDILLVEDTIESAELVKYFLRNEARITWAKDGMTAVGLATENTFDLILMDINLGDGLSGLDVTRYLRTKKQLEHLPIVALTAYAMEEEDSRKAIEAGCTGYLSKPFQREQLYEAVRAAVTSGTESKT
ncbi:MAG TPA: PAS domain S-box protein [Candidatus Kapabacteria bacterium]|nr:PAS domain S-box protein [Candidatus Kapabacteria bacterium]